MRVQPALHQDLVAPQRDRLADLLEQHVAVEHVGLGVVDLAVERAEVADGRADVGVVDVAVDVVGAVRLGMEPPAHRDRRPGPAPAATPNDNSSTPSSKLSRWPSTARCKIAATVEDKAHSFRCQAERRRHRGESRQPGDLRLPEVVG